MGDAGSRLQTGLLLGSEGSERAPGVEEWKGEECLRAVRLQGAVVWCPAHAKQFANPNPVLGVWAMGAVETGLISQFGFLPSPHPGGAAPIAEKTQEPALPVAQRASSFAQHTLLVGA